MKHNNNKYETIRKLKQTNSPPKLDKKFKKKKKKKKPFCFSPFQKQPPLN